MSGNKDNKNKTVDSTSAIQDLDNELIEELICKLRQSEIYDDYEPMIHTENFLKNFVRDDGCCTEYFRVFELAEDMIDTSQALRNNMFKYLASEAFLMDEKYLDMEKKITRSDIEDILHHMDLLIEKMNMVIDYVTNK